MITAGVGRPDENDAQAGRIIPTLRVNYRNNSNPVTARDAKGPVPDRALGTVVVQKVGVRRLTPLECERLQGFPDGWTACIKPEDFQALYIDGRYYSQQELSDSARYRLLGNAVTVPVAEWLGRRLIGYISGRRDG